MLLRAEVVRRARRSRSRATKMRPTASIERTTLRPSSAASARSRNEASIVRVTLLHAEVVRDTCALDRRVTGGGPRELERAPPRRRARAAPARAASSAPWPSSAAVAAQASASPRPALGARLRAERDQLGEVVHRLDAAGRRDPDEPVRVEVVAEQQRRVGDRPGRRAAAGRSGAGSPRRSSRRRARRPARRAPRRRRRSRARRPGAATRPRAGSPPPPRRRASPRRRPQLSKKSPTASIVLSISSSPCASETNMHSNWDGAT